MYNLKNQKITYLLICIVLFIKGFYWFTYVEKPMSSIKFVMYDKNSVQ